MSRKPMDDYPRRTSSVWWPGNLLRVDILAFVGKPGLCTGEFDHYSEILSDSTPTAPLFPAP